MAKNELASAKIVRVKGLSKDFNLEKFYFS